MIVVLMYVAEVKVQGN